MWTSTKFSGKRFWLALAAGVLLIAVLAVWSVRSYRRARAREALNAFAAFQSPALELQFPRVAIDSAENRAILAAGVQNGVWTLHERNSKSASFEVSLTDQGQRWFSVVGNRLVATFKAGERDASDVFELTDTFPSRQIRFHYFWTQFHPACVVLGESLPALGQLYDGEAVFFYDHDHWRLMQWSTPDFDRAVARFKNIEPASN